MSTPDHYSLSSPFIIIDDSDPAIRYNGSWHAANETEIPSNVRWETSPYFNTLHVLQIFSGSFSYDFTGLGISVFAMPDPFANYTSECFLNGTQLAFDPSATQAQFGRSRPVCQAFGLPDDIVHTLSVNIFVQAQQQPVADDPLSGFAFDYMLVQPPSSMSAWDNGTQDMLLSILDGGLTQTSSLTMNFGLILESDPGEQQIGDISPSWEFDPGKGFNTTTLGAQFNLTFTGTSVWWYGYLAIPSNLTSAFNPAGTFSLDGGTIWAMNLSEMTFTPSASQVLLFQTPVLPYGSHQLTVVCGKGNDTAALTLQSLVIQKSTPPVSSSTPTVSSSTHTSRQRGKLGGIVGGVTFLLLVVSAVCIWIRRAKRRRRSMQTRNIGATVAPDPFPVPTEETLGAFAPQKAQLDQQNIVNPFVQQELQAPPLTKWTRRHTILGSSARIPSPSGVRMQPHEPTVSRLSLPADQDASLLHSTDIIIEQPMAQMVDLVDASHPTTTNDIFLASLPTAQGVRQEDSGLRMASESDLPPFYTTH